MILKIYNTFDATHEPVLLRKSIDLFDFTTYNMTYRVTLLVGR